LSYQVKFDEAQKQLLNLIEAAIQGEDVFIFKDNDQVVQLVPVKIPRRRAQFGSAKGLVEVSDDFDEPLSDFAEYSK
jgi:antitoxin (DNA-binding transcriptional repressor) of toxin-antitoxin stability system